MTSQSKTQPKRQGGKDKKMRGKLNYVRSDKNSQTAQRSRDNGKTGGRRYGPRSQENAVSLEPRAEREHKEAKTLPLHGALCSPCRAQQNTHTHNLPGSIRTGGCCENVCNEGVLRIAPLHLNVKETLLVESGRRKVREGVGRLGKSEGVEAGT